MHWLLVACCLLAAASGLPFDDEEFAKCGYESCHETKEGFINVHIVPHTHDDVGWLKTLDQYYYGSKPGIQKAGVQYIIDSVVDALRYDKNRRFIYVETAFFWKWWIKQHDTVKSQVRKYVKNGQLEFVGGAWSMNDEAVTHYHSIIDQFTWGLRKLNDTFGECGRPKLGWQIDPFGHSREMGSIFAQMGYDGLLLGRIDYEEKTFRFDTKTPEMVWKTSPNLGEKSELFTGVLFNTYAPPPGFCFDILCADEPIIDDKHSPDYNVDKRVDEFFAYLKNMSDIYQTDHVVLTMGEDFHYQEANVWFKNLDKLIAYGNARQSSGSKYNLIYSTPSCYLKAVHDDGVRKGIKWSVKEDDFFPYASDPNAYWTGYFTSRPTIKRSERVGNNFLQVCKQLYALTDLGPEDWADLNALREAMGVMQHHDAITGTEKQHVADDYNRILSIAMDECNFVAATALSKLATGNKISQEPKPEIPFDTCHLANISQCALTEKENSFIVTIYNPLSRVVSQHVRLPVTGTAYSVKDAQGATLAVQIVPIHPSVLKIPGRDSTATVELIFEAKDLPPLGYKSYYVSKASGDHVIRPSILANFDNELVTIKINENGYMYEVTMNGKTIPLTQQFSYYRGVVGDNREFKNRSSGAYIFRPNGTDSLITNKASVKLYEGAYVSELHQTINDWISQTIRIYRSENVIEFDWLVGPIPEDDVNGKEIVSKFISELKTDSTFYTDSNGRELLKRVRNFRPTWKLHNAEPAAGNYYPVTSKIVIRDPNQDIEVAVLTDRAQGGSSLKDGEVELMVHRDCLHDDAFGVGEALKEEAYGKGLVARGSHYLVAGPYIHKEGLAAEQRLLAQKKILQPWTFVSPTNGLSFADYAKTYKMEYAGLKAALPDNVQILTLEPWKEKSFLLRLEHILELNEDSKLSKPVAVDLQNLFAPFKIKSFKETTLAANQWLSESDPLKFATGTNQEDLVDYFNSYRPIDETVQNQWIEGSKHWKQCQMESNEIKHDFTRPEEAPEIQADGEFEIILTPMQIRTFVIEISDNA